MKQVADEIRTEDRENNQAVEAALSGDYKRQRLAELERKADIALSRLPETVREMAASKVAYKSILLIENILVKKPAKYLSGEGFRPNSFPNGVRRLFDRCKKEGLRPVLVAPSGRSAVEIIGDYELVIRL